MPNRWTVDLCPTVCTYPTRYRRLLRRVYRLQREFPFTNYQFGSGELYAAENRQQTLDGILRSIRFIADTFQHSAGSIWYP